MRIPAHPGVAGIVTHLGPAVVEHEPGYRGGAAPGDEANLVTVGNGVQVAAQQHGLLPLNQMSLEFYHRVAYHDYEGIALSNAEKSRLVADLGDKPVLILRNHGLLTVGATPGQAFLRMFYLERACEIQVDALAGGAPLVIPPPEVCEYTATQFEGSAHNDDYRDDASPDLAWDAMLRLVERQYPDYKD